MLFVGLSEHCSYNCGVRRFSAPMCCGYCAPQRPQVRALSFARSFAEPQCGHWMCSKHQSRLAALTLANRVQAARASGSTVNDADISTLERRTPFRFTVERLGTCRIKSRRIEK